MVIFQVYVWDVCVENILRRVSFGSRRGQLRKKAEDKAYSNSLIIVVSLQLWNVTSAELKVEEKAVTLNSSALV